MTVATLPTELFYLFAPSILKKLGATSKSLQQIIAPVLFKKKLTNHYFHAFRLYEGSKYFPFKSNIKKIIVDSLLHPAFRAERLASLIHVTHLQLFHLPAVDFSLRPFSHLTYLRISRCTVKIALDLQAHPIKKAKVEFTDFPVSNLPALILPTCIEKIFLVESTVFNSTDALLRLINEHPQLRSLTFKNSTLIKNTFDKTTLESIINSVGSTSLQSLTITF